MAQAAAASEAKSAPDSSAATAASTATPTLAGGLSPLSLCWALDLSAFRRSGTGTGPPFEALLAAAENDPAERQRVMRFHFPQDKQRALLGRMIMHTALSRILDVPIGELRLARSAYGKPFVQHPVHAEKRVAFNISHHGQFVVLAAEALVPAAASTNASAPSLPLLGVDVTTCDRPPSCASISEYLQNMRSCFTEKEWTLIRAGGEQDGPLPVGHLLDDAPNKLSASDVRALVRFAWFWSLKESLIKAIGMGLSFDLQHIEFAFAQPDQRALFSPVTVRFLGKPTFEPLPGAAAATAAGSASADVRVRPPELADGLDVARDVQWSFESAMLMDEQHIVTVCRGVRCKDAQEAAATHSAAPTDPAVAPLSDCDVPVASVAHPLQLAQLGRVVSRRPPSALATDSQELPVGHLQVRVLSHLQMVQPPKADAPAAAAAAATAAPQGASSS